MRRAVIFLLIGLVLIAGTCLLDRDDPAGQDLCVAFLAVTAGAGFDCPLGVTGTLVPVRAREAVLVPLDRPVPPPRA
jgi:hypothetical protein